MPGSIRRRGKYWTVVVDCGVDPITGRRRQIRRSVKGPKREAEGLVARLLHERDQGIDLRPDRLTVAAYLSRWLEDYAGPNIAPSTHKRYEELLRLHLVPALGRLPLAKLRPAHIQAAYKIMQEKGRSPRTVVQAHRILRQALGLAVRWQFLPSNPTDAVAAPRFPKFDIAACDVGEIQRILDAAGREPRGALVRLAVLTGLRLSELLGLRWNDLDLDAGLLRVRQIAQWLPRRGFNFRQPKTHRSVRPVALSPTAVFLLRRHRFQQAEQRLAVGSLYVDQDLVFTGPRGAPPSPSTVRDLWNRVKTTAGLHALRFHDLRHAHASLMLVQGIHPKIVSERLGHSGIGITLDIYTHLLPNLQAEAAAGLDRLLGLDPKKL